MKRHALGLVGFVGSVLVSFALVLPFGPSWYGKRDAIYTRPDGSRVFFVTKQYGSPEEARAALGQLRVQAGPRVIAREAAAARHTFVIFAADQVPGAYSTYGSVWVDGSRLVGIYGPTPSDVLEIEAANSDRLR